MRLDGYIRVSDVGGREGPSFISPDVQRDAILSWANLHGHEIAVMHEELDVSGGKTDRPLLNEVMRRIEAGETEGVVVWKLDRFGRTLVGCLELLKRIQDADANFASVTDQFDLSTPNGRLVLNMMLSIAQFELERIGASWREARGRAARRGHHMGAVAPFGYRKRPEDGRLEPDPMQAPVIREIFERRAAGQSWLALTRWLAGTGVVTARGHSLTTPGLSFIVKNEVYLGTLADRTSRERLENAHPALVDRSTWQAAQNRASGRFATRRRQALTGLVRCAGCRYALALKNVKGAAVGGRRIDAVWFACSHMIHDCPAPVSVPNDDRLAFPESGPAGQGLESYVVDALFERLPSIEAEAFGAETEIGDLETAAREARLALNGHAADIELMEALGRDAYLTRSKALQDVAERADAELAERLRSAGRLSQPVRVLRDDWEQMGVDERRELLGRLIQAVFVRRDGADAGANGERRRAGVLSRDVRIVWFDDPPVDLPRQGRRDYVLRPFLFGDSHDPDGLRESVV